MKLFRLDMFFLFRRGGLFWGVLFLALMFLGGCHSFENTTDLEEKVFPGALLILKNRDEITLRLHSPDGTAFQVKGCKESTLPGRDFSKVRTLQPLEDVVEIHGSLDKFSVQGCESLLVLDCAQNSLSELDVRGCTFLEDLRCSGNKLSQLDLRGLEYLKLLTCHGNRLNGAAFTGIFDALPRRTPEEPGYMTLYDAGDENCKDFTASASLEEAFVGIQEKNWILIASYGK